MKITIRKLPPLSVFFDKEAEGFILSCLKKEENNCIKISDTDFVYDQEYITDALQKFANSSNGYSYNYHMIRALKDKKGISFSSTDSLNRFIENFKLAIEKLEEKYSNESVVAE